MKHEKIRNKKKEKEYIYIYIYIYKRNYIKTNDAKMCDFKYFGLKKHT